MSGWKKVEEMKDETILCDVKDCSNRAKMVNGRLNLQLCTFCYELFDHIGEKTFFERVILRDSYWARMSVKKVDAILPARMNPT